MLLAYTASPTCDLGFMAIVVSSLTNRNLTPSTIQPRTLCDCFELPEEMAIRFSILICEQLAVGHRVLLVRGQQRTQLSGERDLSFLVILWKECDNRFALATYRASKPL
jgi:hypothetical protein